MSSVHHRFNLYRQFLLLGVALVPLFALSNPVVAAPPEWAPAYGRHNHQPPPPPRPYDRRRHDHSRGYNLLPWLGGVAVTGYLVGNRCNREAAGSVLGGLLGGLAGSSVGRGHDRGATTLAGALIGVLVGRSIGRHMDQADQYCTGQTLEYAPDRETIYWDNPESGAAYNVTPINHYQTRDGDYCREYTSQVKIGGKLQQAYGTACRQPDGSWRIVD